MKDNIKKLKQELKEIAKQIKEQKKIRKLNAKGHEFYIGDWQVHNLSQSYRLRHVAYCLARGRTLEQVDSGKNLDMDSVNWIISTLQPDSKAKLYVVVNQDLAPSQRAVQAAHAVAEFMKIHRNTQWRNGHLVILKDKPEWRGDMHCPYYARKGDAAQVAFFKEPDLENKVTAYAVFSYSAEEAFKGKQLI